MNQVILSNGIRLIHRIVPRNPIVTVQVFMDAGAIRETAAQAGIATLTQAVMMKGTTTRSADQIAREMEDIGAVITTDAEHDFCQFGVSVTTASTTAAVALLSDVLLHPSFPAAEMEKERANLLASLKSRQDQIFHVANDRCAEALYGAHPYGRPDAGTPATVKALTRADLIAWHRDHILPGMVTLVVVGDIAEADARALGEKYFTVTVSSRTALSSVPPAVPAAPRAERIDTDKFQQAYLMVGFPAPAIGTPDFPALKVINALMGSRMTGRLFTELREKMSLGYEVSSFYPSRRTTSRFVIYLGLDARNRDKAYARIRELLQELKDTPVPLTELEDTKRYMRGVYTLDHQTIGRQAWHLGWWDVMGPGYAYDEGYRDAIAAVTADDIRRVARTYFTEACTKVEVVPTHSSGK